MCNTGILNRILIAILWMIFLGTLLVTCNPESGITPPLRGADYTEVTVEYDSLPGYYMPAALQFTITVTGRNGQLLTARGDTLRYLTLWFEGGDSVEGTNAASDTLWSQAVIIGQTLQFHPAFQVTRWSEQGGIWYTITIHHVWSPQPITTKVDSGWSDWMFVFNPVTEYTDLDNGGGY